DPGRLDRNELLRLLADWANGALDAAGGERLDTLLATHAEARQTYLQYATVEAELHSALATPGRVSQERLATAMDASARERRRRVRRWSVATFAAAAAVLAAVGVSLWSSAPVEGPSIAMTDPSEDRTTAAATITATRNCRWEGDSRGLGYGSPLQAGDTIELAAGLAEVRFADGGFVVLEGPAVLRLGDGQSPASAVLLAGRLAATSPASDGRLPAATPRLGVKLAGAAGAGWSQYGLSSDANRGDEVHVFRGELRAFFRGAEFAGDPSGVPAESAQSIELASNEAARLRPTATTVAKFFADRDRFVRSIAATGGPQDGLYAYEGFDYPGGPLGGQNGGFGWAGAWADIEAACPPGEVATNVAEPGSLLRRGVRAIGGRAVQNANQNRIRRVLSTSLGGVFDSAGLVENQDGHRLVGADGTAVYLSFLQRTSRTDDVFYGVELHRGDGNGNRVLCVGNGADEAGYGVTSNYNAYGKANYLRLGAEDVDTNFLVVKIEFRGMHRDLVTVYRNPRSLIDESRCEVAGQMRGNFAFDRIGLGNFQGEKVHEVDELRIGTTYRAVTGRRDRGGERLLPPVA
ncbi:MAG: hypothetical protein AAF805_15160, partial [Planctomycetota bacterium]